MKSVTNSCKVRIDIKLTKMINIRGLRVIILLLLLILIEIPSMKHKRASIKRTHMISIGDHLWKDRVNIMVDSTTTLVEMLTNLLQLKEIIKITTSNLNKV